MGSGSDKIVRGVVFSFGHFERMRKDRKESVFDAERETSVQILTIFGI
ncbi:MAG: hypothetical protein Q4G69_07650 [Planctomycetia bacterium]|nr:hypothetical protein [Planctomycetia bacterium]